MNKVTLLKNLGVGLIALGALLLILGATVPFMNDLIDYNAFTFGAAGLVIVGLLLHIILNKRLPLDE